MVKNTWIPKDIQKLYPAPSTLLATLTVQKSFPQAVAQDTIKTASDGLAYVYALPLHFDALALFYNKDIFNAHAIVYPPTTWDEVVALVPKLRVQDEQKNLTRAAIALGSAKTSENFDDVLSALMMQSGATLINTNGEVVFDDAARKTTEFFLQFSNPSNTYYGWNDSLGNARDAFASQKLALLVDYYSAQEIIRAKNNFIQMDVAPLPQLASSTQDKKTLASYWTLGVSRVSLQPYVAWHFIRYMTLNPDINTLYLTATKRLPALLSLIQNDLSGENSVFLKSFLYARTWLRPNDVTVKNSLARMIENITLGRTDVSKGLRIAQEEINSSR
jgi:ABC-type glycerol-3-phosphate transport system substrate-binding protein